MVGSGFLAAANCPFCRGAKFGGFQDIARPLMANSSNTDSAVRSDLRAGVV